MRTMYFNIVMQRPRPSVQAPLRSRQLGLLAMMAWLLVACQTPGPLSSKQADDLVWPQPPAQARIRYIASITGPEDLGIQSGFFSRMYRYLIGKEKEILVSPYAVSVDDQGRIYAVDTGLRQVHMFDPAAGAYHRFPDDRDELASPVAVAIDSQSGRIYVSDSKLGVVKIFGQNGKKPMGQLGRTLLVRPTGVAVNTATRELLVVDTQKGQIQRFSLPDHRHIGTIGTPGRVAGQLHYPTHIFTSADGRVYITDALNFRIQIFTADGQPLGLFGQVGDSPGSFARPRGVAADSFGHIYVVDALFDNIQIFDAQYRLLMALGRPGQAYGRFWLPGGIHIDAQDRIYVADMYNKRIQIFELIKEIEGKP